MDDLVLAPWKEILLQGTVAVRNAGTAGDERMLKVARGLVREGERALKKLGPLCQKNAEEFGTSFVNALKDNDEISRFIEDLNNLLYDFEDYVGVDNFDAEKVGKLQELSKKAALRIYHIIMIHMRLEPAHIDLNAFATAASTATTPITAVGNRIQNDIQPRSEHAPYPEDNELDFQVKYAMSFVSDPGTEAGDVPASLLRLQQHRNSRYGEVSPSSPSTPDPWWSSAQVGLVVDQPKGTVDSRDSAVWPEPGLDHNPAGSLAFRITPARPAIPNRNPNRATTDVITPADTLSPPPELNRPLGRESTSSIPPRVTSWDPAGSSAGTSIRSSISNYRHERDSYPDGISPTSLAPRALPYLTINEQHGQSPYVPPLFTRASPALSTNPTDDAIEPVFLPPSSLSMYDGLIPVEEESVSPVVNPVPPLGGCAITLSSSFSQYKGFCQGAMEAIHGGVGVRHIKKQGLTTANIEVAKCKDCAYELEWEAVRRDINCEASENFTSKSAGIGFRLRFFSKSHLHTKYVGDQTYGCLFCVQLRHTTHANDATVFFSQRQLFAHLARHPRPLPAVPGLTVVEGDEIPPHLANNYDVHLPHPPKIPHLATVARDVAALPTATALQTNRATPVRPMRMAPDQADVLSFAVGAKLVGIVFPSRYQGLWCVGWADHAYGTIPVEAIQLDPPRKSDAMVNFMNRRSSGGSTSMKAVARWRFSVKEKEKLWGGEWLSFSKGEVIVHIGWSYQDHWCWWGTNSKGKSGMFPRAFIEPGTLIEAEPTPDRANSSPIPDKKSKILSRISLRNRGSSS